MTDQGAMRTFNCFALPYVVGILVSVVYFKVSGVDSLIKL